MNSEIIAKGFSGEISTDNKELQNNVFETIEALDKGKVRVCEKLNGTWVTHAWVKQAILLYFRLQKMTVMESGIFKFIDKIPLKNWSIEDGVRVVPSSVARKGSYIHPGCILMPSYVNIGAFVDEGTMVDTWATVGSCAQIGKNVHLSGGVGIGGVLEPAQASPVIIEDHVFVGSRSIIVEGVRVEEGAVIAAGVTLTASTKIIDVTQEKEVIIKGSVPKNAVVIPGTVSKQFKAGTYQTQCALIIGSRTESTDKKTSLNQTLREFDLSV